MPCLGPCLDLCRLSPDLVSASAFGLPCLASTLTLLCPVFPQPSPSFALPCFGPHLSLPSLPRSSPLLGMPRSPHCLGHRLTSAIALPCHASNISRPCLALLGTRLACHTITSPSNCLALTRPSPRLVWPCLELHLALRCIGPRLPCLASPLALPYLTLPWPRQALHCSPQPCLFSVLASPCLDDRIALLRIALVLELNFIALPRLSPSLASVLALPWLPSAIALPFLQASEYPV